jgi:putative membrane protein
VDGMTELLTQAAQDPTYWNHHHGGWWFLAPLFWIGVWILIIVAIRGLFWRRWHRRAQRRGWYGWPGSENDPRSVLAGRYARGEIDETEYRQRLNVLNNPQG